MSNSKSVTDAFSLYTCDTDDLLAEMKDALGDISKVEIWGNLVMIGVFARPHKTTRGILYGGTAKEDVWQGKVGVILMIGPDAFPEKAETFGGRKPQVGDWVWHNANEIVVQHFLAGPGHKMREENHPTDGLKKTRDWTGWPVRIVEGRCIYGRVTPPEMML